VSARFWSAVLLSPNPVRRLLPFKVWQSRKPPPQQALTICTTLTQDRLDMLDAQCASWPGPLAAVVYVPVLVNAHVAHVPGNFTEEQQGAVHAAMEAVQLALDRWGGRIICKESVPTSRLCATQWLHSDCPAASITPFIGLQGCL
jgi:hypothetical protein